MGTAAAVMIMPDLGLPHWLAILTALIHWPLLGAVGWLIYRGLISDYQLRMIWRDYKSRHHIDNGDS